MDQGSLRCDVNLSLRPDPSAPLGTRTETKNVNSFRSIERAVRYEVSRQAAVLAGGGRIVQETRHWHEDTGVTTPGRPKEEAEDYRYFPEPDLVPVAPGAEWVESLRTTSAGAPRRTAVPRLQQTWGFSDLEMRDVVGAGAVVMIEQTVGRGASPAAAKKWWLSELARRANDQDVQLADLPVTPRSRALQALVDSGRINDTLARQVLDGVLAGRASRTVVTDARSRGRVGRVRAVGRRRPGDRGQP